MIDDRKIPDELACKIEDFSPEDPMHFTLRTVSVDADDEGRPRDYGKVLVEGEVVGEDEEQVKVIAELISHLPDLYWIAKRARAKVLENPREFTDQMLLIKLNHIFGSSSGSVIF